MEFEDRHPDQMDIPSCIERARAARAQHLAELVAGATRALARRLRKLAAALRTAPVGARSRALRDSAGNQTHAARLLDISRDALRYKMKKFGLMHAEEEEGTVAPG